MEEILEYSLSETLAKCFGSLLEHTLVKVSNSHPKPATPSLDVGKGLFGRAPESVFLFPLPAASSVGVRVTHFKSWTTMNDIQLIV